MIENDFSVEQELTQYGHLRTGFRQSPRWDREKAVSVIAGRLEVEQATLLVTGRRARRGDAVRYSTVGRLHGAGFVTRSDPQPLNPAHVLVEYPGEWSEDIGEAFDRCFEPPVAKETS